MLKNKRLTKHLSLASSDKMVGEFVLRSATEVNKLLWYTFNTLVDSHDGTAHISTLKVNSTVETILRVMQVVLGSVRMRYTGNRFTRFYRFVGRIPSDSSQNG